MGCVARIGCLGLIVFLAITGWFTRDRWLHVLRGTPPATSATTPWEPLTASRAARAKQTLDALASPSGPVYANLTGAEAASYVYSALMHAMPTTTDSAAAAVIGNALVLRASVRPADLGGSATLGSIGAMLGDREPVQFAGTFHMLHPGLAEFDVTNVQMRGFSLPSSLIPNLIARMERGSRPAGLMPNGLPLLLPAWISDVRVANGRITLYKNT